MRRKGLLSFRIIMVMVFLCLLTFGVFAQVKTTTADGAVEDQEQIEEEFEEGEDDGFIDVSKDSEEAEEYLEEQANVELLATNIPTYTETTAEIEVNSINTLAGYLTNSNAYLINLTADLKLTSNIYINSRLKKYGSGTYSTSETACTKEINLNGHTLDLGNYTIYVGYARVYFSNGTIKAAPNTVNTDHTWHYSKAGYHAFSVGDSYRNLSSGQNASALYFNWITMNVSFPTNSKAYNYAIFTHHYGNGVVINDSTITTTNGGLFKGDGYFVNRFSCNYTEVTGGMNAASGYRSNCALIVSYEFCPQYCVISNTGSGAAVSTSGNVVIDASTYINDGENENDGGSGALFMPYGNLTVMGYVEGVEQYFQKDSNSNPLTITVSGNGVVDSLYASRFVRNFTVGTNYLNYSTPQKIILKDNAKCYLNIDSSHEYFSIDVSGNANMIFNSDGVYHPVVSMNVSGGTVDINSGRTHIADTTYSHGILALYNVLESNLKVTQDTENETVINGCFSVKDRIQTIGVISSGASVNITGGTFNSTSYYGSLYMTGGSYVNISGGVFNYTGAGDIMRFRGQECSLTATNYPEVYISGGTFNYDGLGYNGICMEFNASLTITGGTFNNNGDSNSAMIKGKYGAMIEIDGGTFTGGRSVSIDDNGEAKLAELDIFGGTFTDIISCNDLEVFGKKLITIRALTLRNSSALDISGSLAINEIRWNNGAGTNMSGVISVFGNVTLYDSLVLKNGNDLTFMTDTYSITCGTQGNYACVVQVNDGATKINGGGAAIIGRETFGGAINVGENASLEIENLHVVNTYGGCGIYTVGNTQADVSAQQLKLTNVSFNTKNNNDIWMSNYSGYIFFSGTYSNTIDVVVSRPGDYTTSPVLKTDTMYNTSQYNRRFNVNGLSTTMYSESNGSNGYNYCEKINGVIAPTVNISDSINKTYDGSISYLSVSLPDAASNNGVSYSYAWYKTGSSTVLSTSYRYGVTNAQSSASYYCIVTASLSGFTSKSTTSETRNIYVAKKTGTITKVDLNIDFGTDTYTGTYSTNISGGTLSVSDTSNVATSSGVLSTKKFTLGNLRALSLGNTFDVTIKITGATNYTDATATFKVKIVDHTILISTVDQLEEFFADGNYYTKGILQNDLTYSQTDDLQFNVTTHARTLDLNAKTLTLTSIIEINTNTCLTVENGTLKNTSTGNGRFMLNGGFAFYLEDLSIYNYNTYGIVSDDNSAVNTYFINCNFVSTTSGFDVKIEQSIIAFEGDTTFSTGVYYAGGKIDLEMYTGDPVNIVGFGENVKNGDQIAQWSKLDQFVCNVADYILYDNTSATYEYREIYVRVMEDGYVTLSSISTEIEYGTEKVTFTITSHHGGALEIQCSVNGITTNLEGTTVTISNLSTLSAGYSFTVKVVSDEYNQYYPAYEDHTIRIVRKTINIPNSPADKTYNASVQQHGITIPTGASIVTTGSTTSATNVGTYTVILKVGSNYCWKVGNSTSTANQNVKWKIVTAPVGTITFDNLSVVYNGSSQGITSTSPTGITKIEYTYVGTTLGNVSYNSTTAPSAAGTYTVTAKYTVDSNHSSVANKTATLTITQKTVTFSWGSRGSIPSLTYNGNPQVPIYTFSGVVNGDDCKPVLDGHRTDAGTGYTARYTGVTNINYKMAGSIQTCTFTIDPAKLTITAKDHSIVYGAAPAGNGVTYSGFVNGETESVLTGTLSYSHEYVRYNPVGDYDITPQGLSSSNYSITFVDGVLTVTQKAISISWADTTVTYNGEEQSPKATATGLVNGDTCTITLTGVPQKNVGTYTATASSLSNSNYKLPTTNLSSTFVIEKADLTVNISINDIVTDFTGSSVEVNPTNSKSFFTLLGTDDESVVTFTLGSYTYEGIDGTSYAQSTTAPKNAGKYEINLPNPTATAANYEVEVVVTDRGTLTIQVTDGKLVLSATSGSCKFPNTVTITVKENVSGGALSVSSSSTDYATAKVSGNSIIITPVKVTSGTPVTITVTAAANGSYSSASATYELTINNGTLTVADYTATGWEGTYDAQYHGITVSCTGATITYSETENGTYSNTNPTYKAAATKTVYYKITKPNYDTVTGSKQVIINKKDITITATAEDKSTEYTGSNPNVEYSYTVDASALYTGDTLTYDSTDVVYTIKATKDVNSVVVTTYNAGTYGIHMSGLTATNANYNVTINYVAGTLTITKKAIAKPTAKTEEIIYDGTEHDYIPVNFNDSYMTIASNKYKNAGAYSATVSLKDTTNFKWTDNTNTGFAIPFNVSKKVITLNVEVQDGEHVYTGSADLYKNNLYTPGFVLVPSTLCGTDTVETAFSVDKSNIKYLCNGSSTFYGNAGEYTITIKNGTITISSANYNFGTPTYSSGAYTINKADIVVEYSDASKVYDGTKLSKGVTATAVNNQALTYKYYDAEGNEIKPEITNAGSLAVYFKVTAPNHNDYVSGSVYYTLTVTQREIKVVVTPADETVVYTGTATYTKQNDWTVEATVKSGEELVIPADDIVKLSGTPSFKFGENESSTLDVNVGEQIIKMYRNTLLLKSVSGNFSIATSDITFGTGTFTITAADITTDVENYKGTYDGKAHSGNENALTVDGSTPVIYYSEKSLAEAQNYADAKNTSKTTRISKTNSTMINNQSTAVTIYFVVTAANHTNKTGSFTITIDKANLAVTVKPNDQTSTYSNAVTYVNEGYEFTGSTGLMAGETTSVLTPIGDPIYKFDGSTTINQNANESGYKITIEGLSFTADNYIVNTTFTEGKLIINRKSLSTDVTIEINNPEAVIYTGEKLEPGFTANVVLVSGQTPVTLPNGSYTTQYFNNINAGENTAYVTITAAEGSNYKDSYTKYFTINKAEMGEFVADLDTKTVTVLVVNGDEVALRKLSDIDLSQNKTDGYGAWKFDSKYDLTQAIYQSGVYEYTYDMVFESTNSNYKSVTGQTLKIVLVKNTVEFEALPTVRVTYTMNVIQTPEYVVANSDSGYMSAPTVKYYLSGSEMTETPKNAGTYSYKVVVAENEYYSEATSAAKEIVIDPKDVSELTFVDVTNLVYNNASTYTGSALKPVVTVKFDAYTLVETTDMKTTWSNNINANDKLDEKAIITIKGYGNYTGQVDITFTINPKDINECTFEEIESMLYQEKELTPPVVIKDAARNNVQLTLNSDYTTNYSNNKNVGTAEILVTGINNYTNTKTVTFEIELGNLDPSRLPNLPLLKSTVDALLSTLTENGQMTDTIINGTTLLSNTDGRWVFWNTTEAYADQKVSEEATTVQFGVKFIPRDSNFNEVTNVVSILVELNESSVSFVELGNVKPVYDTYAIELSDDNISKTDKNGNAYEEEFANDVITFTYKNSEGKIIAAPANAGTYTVTVTVQPNRKYKMATATQEFTISPKALSSEDIEFAFTDNYVDPNLGTDKAFYSGNDGYEYTTQAIKPSFKLTFNSQTLNSSLADYTITGYENNVELSTTDNKAYIVIATGDGGNYTGTTKIPFTIIQKDISTLEIDSIADQYYKNGNPVEPGVTIYSIKPNLLTAGTDYELDYENNINPGTATVTITAVAGGNYRGSTTKKFVIIQVEIPAELLVGAELKNLSAIVGTKLVDIELPSNTFGKWYFVDITEDATVGEANLLGNRFAVEFRDNNNEYNPTKDTVTIIVTKKTISIEITSVLDKVYDRLAVSNPTYKVTYDNEEVELTPVVTFYQNGVATNAPVNAGTYQVVVSYAEDATYTAATSSQTFTISRAEIGKNGVTVEKIGVQQYQAGITLTPTVTIKHNNGVDTVNLVLDTDFFAIYGANNTIGETAGTVSIVGMGNYMTNPSIKEYFAISESVVTDKNGQVVSTIVSISDYTYTGSEITPEIIVSAEGAILTEGTDYSVSKIEGYDYTNAGQHAYKVTYSENYNGDETAYFTINKYVLQATDVNIENTVEGTNPVVTVKHGDIVLAEGTHYTVTFPETPVVGNNTATVAALSGTNYDGSVNVTYVVEESEPNVLTIIETNTFYQFYNITANAKNIYRFTWVGTDSEDFTKDKEVFLVNVSHNQYVSQFKTQFENSADRLRLTSAAGKVLADTALVSNGTLLELLDAEGNTIDKATIVIYGDILCDGRINGRDKGQMYDYFNNGTVKEIYQMIACDVLMTQETGRGSERVNTKDINFIDEFISNPSLGTLNAGYLIQ